MSEKPFRLVLDTSEAGALVCLIKLGVDRFSRQRLDMATMKRLDRLPAEAFDSLALKLRDATEDMDLEGDLASNDR